MLIAGCGGGNGHGIRSTPDSTTTSTRATTTSTDSGAAQEHSPGLGSPAAVRSAVEAVLTSNDPADVCGRFATERYLKAAYGDKQGCVRAQQPGSAARSLKSFGVAQEAGQGTSVVADAVPVGGPYGGHTVHVGLVFAGDRYRVDSMKADLPVGP